MRDNVIDMRKRFLWLQCAARLRRGEIKKPSSKELMNELKDYVIYGKPQEDNS